MSKKQNRDRKNTGWAETKVYPHENHPAHYRKKDQDSIEYITFTHSSEVKQRDGGKIQTVPMKDNISPAEREKNKQKGLKSGENRSYAYPKVFEGKRSALHKETADYEPVDFDKKRIKKMFEVFPREKVPITGGATKYRDRKKKRK